MLESVYYNITLYQGVCRDGGGCLYTVIQWKTAASVLQSGNWMNRTVEVKVRTIQKTLIPILSRENAPARRKRP